MTMESVGAKEMWGASSGLTSITDDGIAGETFLIPLIIPILIFRSGLPRLNLAAA
jgi:hypothetical protein